MSGSLSAVGQMWQRALPSSTLPPGVENGPGDELQLLEPIIFVYGAQ